MLWSRCLVRSAGLSITGSRGRPEPPEPAAARLAAMASRLPGVHGSRQSEGSGTGAAGAVVALVDPESVEVCVRCTAMLDSSSGHQEYSILFWQSAQHIYTHT